MSKKGMPHSNYTQEKKKGHEETVQRKGNTNGSKISEMFNVPQNERDANDNNQCNSSHIKVGDL